MSDRMKRFLFLIAVWIVPPLAFFAFPADFPVIAPFVILFAFLEGVAMIFVFIILAICKKGRSQPITAVMLMILIGCLLSGRILKTGAELHLLTNRARYEGIAKAVIAVKDEKEREKICGEDCFIASDEPLRISFHYCHWFLNWTDIVYDPSNTLSDPKLVWDHKLGDYFHGGERLRDNWYLGYFGD